jgi:predicted DNA-binding mobile mystery protein A
MSSIQKTLIQKQMDELIQAFVSGKQNVQTSAGWIQSARLALGMSLRQLAERVGVSVSALTNFEKREQADSVSLATLKKAANAMDMELVYYFKPKDGSVKNAVEKQARKKAQEILNQSNQTMKLEDQETNSSSQERELERLTKDIVSKMPQNLWD